MGTKVTFRPLKRGRYRVIIDGVLSKIITKNPKKTRHSIVRAADAPRIQKVKEEERRRKKENESLNWWRVSSLSGGYSRW